MQEEARPGNPLLDVAYGQLWDRGYPQASLVRILLVVWPHPVAQVLPVALVPQSPCRHCLWQHRAVEAPGVREARLDSAR